MSITATAGSHAWEPSAESLREAYPEWPDHYFREPERRTGKPGEFMYRTQDEEFADHTLRHGIAPRRNAGMLPGDPEKAVYMTVDDGVWHARPEERHPGTPEWRAAHPPGSFWKIDVSGLPLVEDRTYTNPEKGTKRAWMSTEHIGPDRLSVHERGSETGVTYDLPGGGTRQWLPPKQAVAHTGRDEIETGVLQPSDLSRLAFADYPGQGISSVYADLQRRQPVYMAELERDIRRRGVSHPLEIAHHDEDAWELGGGHHRAAIAWKHGLQVPYVRTQEHGDWDPPASYLRANDRWRRLLRELPGEYDARMRRGEADDPFRAQAAARPGRAEEECSCCEGEGVHPDGTDCPRCERTGTVPRGTRDPHCPDQGSPRRRHWREAAAYEIQRRQVPLTDLIARDDDMREVLSSGRVSRTPDEPVYLKARSDMPGKYEIADGHHRVADAIRSGRGHVEADIDDVPDDEPLDPPFYDFSSHYRLGRREAARLSDAPPPDHMACGPQARTVWLHADDRDPRCTACGHRVADPVTGEPPVETRTRPPHQWPAEVVNRQRARRATASSPQPDYDPSDPLPQGRGIWYRLHVKERPLDEAHARSRPFEPPPGKSGDPGLRGYSAFPSPHTLSQYLDEYGWAGELTHPSYAEVVAFHGHVVGRGDDNEPLIAPRANPKCCGRVIHARMPFGEFEDRILEPPEGIPDKRVPDKPWDSKYRYKGSPVERSVQRHYHPVRRGRFYPHEGARRDRALPNAHTGGDEWFHGSPWKFGTFGEGASSLAHQSDPFDTSHWNANLGHHFAASHQTAEEFSRGEHSADPGSDYGPGLDYGYGDSGEEPPAGNVIHARLHIRNPKVYASEHDMDQEAYEREWKAGNHHDLHHEPGLNDEEWGDYEPEDDERPLTYQYAGHGDRMRSKNEGDSAYWNVHRTYHPYATGWLNAHPDKYGIARRFREHLRSQGHDGIIYGNEFEGSQTGKGDKHTLAAIPFSPHQIDVTQRHSGPQCIDRSAAERSWPGSGQPTLPDMPRTGSVSREAMTHEELDRHLQDWFSPKRLDAEKEIHPKSGWPVKTGTEFRVAKPPKGQDEGPAEFRVQLHHGVNGRKMFPDDLPNEPIGHVYRGVSHDEWVQAKERGYIRSDQRGTIADWEGTNAGVDPRTAVSYLPYGGIGHVVKIRVDPRDKWFTIPHDQYLRTRERIPLDRVEEVSPLVKKDEHGIIRHVTTHRPWAQRREAAAFMPSQRIFGPTYGLDHRLFENDRMRPVVRKMLLTLLDGSLEPVLGHGWKSFTRAWLMGSEASRWTSPDLEGNGDLDVIIALDPRRHDDPARLNGILRATFSEPQWRPPFDPGNIYDLTGYVSNAAWNPRDINPYAAYDLLGDRWAIEPPDLPGWSADQFPQGKALFAEARALAAQVRAILKLPEPYRCDEASRLWEHLRAGRSADFSPGGLGWMGTGNALEKALDQMPGRLVDRLKSAAYSSPVVKQAIYDEDEWREFDNRQLPPLQPGQKVFHGTRSVLHPGDVLTPGEANRYPSHPVPGQENQWVHLTAKGDEAHRWGETSDAWGAQKRAEEAGRGLRIRPGYTAHDEYRPRVYEVEPTGATEMDPDKEGMSYRTSHPVRVIREVRPLYCGYPGEHESGEDEEHWPDHPHYPYLEQQDQEDDDEDGWGHHEASYDDDDDDDDEDTEWKDHESQYVRCAQGHRHYGPHGAAGFLIRHKGDDGEYSYLLQHRSPYVQEGGTWSTPGGALNAGETPMAGARRETEEEFGPLPADLSHHKTVTDDHGGWKYHTVVMNSSRRFSPRGAGAGHEWESGGHGWFTKDEMNELPLHSGFAASRDRVLKSGSVAVSHLTARIA